MATASAPQWDLKTLVAWQVARKLVATIYTLTRPFPPEERFGLSLQMRRAAVSVVSNIAEGHGRSSKREFARFALIARGSLKELETQVMLSGDLGFSTAEACQASDEQCAHLNRLLTGLIRRLKTTR